jgi:acyl carrier protein
MKLVKEDILNDLITILNDMISDWDMELDGSIGPETGLVGDLSFESIDIVQLIVAIQEQYRRRDLPFEVLLMKDGRYVDEIKVGDAVNFLSQHLNNVHKEKNV